MSSARIDRTGGRSGPPEINRHNSLTPSGQPLIIPSIEDDLLGYLDALFPNTLTQAHEHGLERATGRRDVVEHLRELHRQQNTKDA